jgi:hypothetical protein
MPDHPIPEAADKMSALDCVAFWALPFASIATFRHSRIVSAACAIAFFASIAYLDTMWNPLRWSVAVMTGAMGVFALGRIASSATTIRDVLANRAPWLCALLVGSSCADVVSLHLEAMGHAWGPLPVWQIVTLGLMVAISLWRNGTSSGGYSPSIRIA